MARDRHGTTAHRRSTARSRAGTSAACQRFTIWHASRCYATTPKGSRCCASSSRNSCGSDFRLPSLVWTVKLRITLEKGVVGGRGGRGVVSFLRSCLVGGDLAACVPLI